MNDRQLMQQANEFNPDWDVMAVMVEEQQRMAQRIEELEAALAQPEQKHSEQWWRHEVSNAYANGYEKGRASVKQPEQEPVAWADKYDLDREGHDFWVSRQANVRTGVPLYTAPPQREWQGLTDEEMRQAAQAMDAEPLAEGWQELNKFACAIEAKLKEKNHAI